MVWGLFFQMRGKLYMEVRYIFIYAITLPLTSLGTA